MNNHEDISPEERDVDEILSKASEKIGDFEKQIENLPRDKGPVYTPGRELNTWPTETKTQRELFLRKQIDAVKAEARSEAGKVIENSSLDTRIKVGDKIYRWKNPNAKDKGEQKDLTEAQDRLSSYMGTKKAEKTTNPVIDKTEKNAPAKTGGEKPEITPLSMRFSMTLRYNSIPDKTVKAPAKTKKSPTIEKDRD